MKQITESSDIIVQKLMADSYLFDDVEVIAECEIIRTFLKKLIAADYQLIRCNLSDNDNWQYLSIENGEIEVGEFYSTSTSDKVYLQQNFDDNIDFKSGAEIVLFELKYGAE